MNKNQRYLIIVLIHLVLGTCAGLGTVFLGSGINGISKFLNGSLASIIGGIIGVNLFVTPLSLLIFFGAVDKVKRRVRFSRFAAFILGYMLIMHAIIGKMQPHYLITNIIVWGLYSIGMAYLSMKLLPSDIFEVEQVIGHHVSPKLSKNGLASYRKNATPRPKPRPAEETTTSGPSAQRTGQQVR